MSAKLTHLATRILRYTGIGLGICCVVSIGLFLLVPWAAWLSPWRNTFALGALLPLLAFAFWLKFNQYHYEAMFQRWMDEHGLTYKDFVSHTAVPVAVFLAAWSTVGIVWLVSPAHFAGYWESLSLQLPQQVLALVPRQWQHGSDGGVAGLSALFVLLLLPCSFWQMIRAFRRVKDVNGIALYRLGVQFILNLIWTSLGWFGLSIEDPDSPFIWPLGSVVLATGVLHFAVILGALFRKLFPPVREV